MAQDPNLIKRPITVKGRHQSASGSMSARLRQLTSTVGSLCRTEMAQVCYHPGVDQPEPSSSHQSVVQPRTQPAQLLREALLPLTTLALMKSRFIRPMKSRLICLGQAASHSPILVQLPKPSCSALAIIDSTR